MDFPDLDDIQHEVGTWGDRTFPASTSNSVIAHFLREVKEFVDEPSPEEAADCLILLLHHAHKNGYSLNRALKDKFAVNRARTWGMPDAQGVVEHVREEITK